ncbi:porin [Pseudomonadota bacterium]
MKKTIISLAVAAGMAVSSAAFAEATVYGQLHLSILSFDKDDGTGAGLTNPILTSNTSAVGVKGSEDLGDGMKAFYKAEFQLDAAAGGSADTVTDFDCTVDATSASTTEPVDCTVTGTSSDGNALTQRDVYAGIKGGMGTVKFGTMSSNYKQKGGSVDALYRTPAEGRGFIHTQSKLHGGRDINRGRMTNAIQYSSPKMGGMQLVVNTTLSDNEDETMGVGFRYEAKSFSVFADYIDTAPSGGSSINKTETATKLGAKFATGAFFVGAQFESAEDVVGYNYVHVNGGYAIDANNVVVLTYGTASHITNSLADTAGMALAYDHKMSKNTDVYVAYVDKSSDTASVEDSALAAGIRVKF